MYGRPDVSVQLIWKAKQELIKWKISQFFFFVHNVYKYYLINGWKWMIFVRSKRDTYISKFSFLDYLPH